MKKFLITHTRQFIVEADTIDDAKETFWERFDNFDEGGLEEGEDRLEVEETDTLP